MSQDQRTQHFLYGKSPESYNRSFENSILLSRESARRDIYTQRRQQAQEKAKKAEEELRQKVINDLVEAELVKEIYKNKKLKKEDKEEEHSGARFMAQIEAIQVAHAGL